MKSGVVLFESVILPGPIHPGARESISSIELSYCMFRCAPEKEIIDVSEKTIYAPSLIVSVSVLVCCFGKKTKDGG